MAITPDKILSLVDHGFTIHNPFKDHNYAVILDLFSKDTTRIAAMQCPTFKRKLNRYNVMFNSATHWVQHILKSTITYSKRKVDEVALKHSIGKPNTMVWTVEETRGRLVVYASLYEEGDDTHLLHRGILLTWQNWQLESVQQVSLSDKPKFTDIFKLNVPITKETLYYGLKTVEPKISYHLNRQELGAQVRQMILGELCTPNAWGTAMDFLKHFTGDYTGIDGIIGEAQQTERNLVWNELDQDDIKTVGRMVIQYINAVVGADNVRYISETEFSNLSKSKRPRCTIIYGMGSCLHYGYKAENGDYYYLRMDDCRRIKSFLKDDGTTPLLQLEPMLLADIAPVIAAIPTMESKS